VHAHQHAALPTSVVFPPSTINANKSSALSIAPTITGATGATLSFSISPDLASGLTLFPTTGVINGTPTVVRQAATCLHQCLACLSDSLTRARVTTGRIAGARGDDKRWT
jgi:hypothetical protein